MFLEVLITFRKIFRITFGKNASCFRDSCCNDTSSFNSGLSLGAGLQVLAQRLTHLNNNCPFQRHDSIVDSLQSRYF